jgi:rubrerythrin
MNRLLLILALSFIVFTIVRARRRSLRSDRHSGAAPRRERGAPRALVCGDCGTHFAPDAQGWICPKCGK